MDVAEQSLTALEMLSKRHGKNILQAVCTMAMKIIVFHNYSFLNLKNALDLSYPFMWLLLCEDEHFKVFF